MNTNETALVVKRPEVPMIAQQRSIDYATWNALKEIYDNASDESLALAFDYCTARKLDIIKKPVHIVPSWSSRRKCMVDSIWPGIAEVRITAMRTGFYAGRDETKFGPTVTQDLGMAKNFSYPEWAQTTVYRMIGGTRCSFPGPRVYWLESYAPLKRGEHTPNSMWMKRPWGQLDKCCEAAALRAAFPEENGGLHTVDEMRGPSVDDEGMIRVREESPAGATSAAAEEAPAKKRAAVPRKAKGAAAMSAGPIVEADPAPPAPSPVASPEKEAEAPVEATVTPVEEPETPAPPAAEEQPPADAGSKPEPEWPKVVYATIDECVERPISGNPKYKTIKIAILGGGTCRVNGKELPVRDLGKVFFDPERPELKTFANVSNELLELTIIQQPAHSNPEVKNLVIVKALVADVAM
jgi:phage recombination protein Bet